MIKEIFSRATLNALWVFCAVPYREFYLRELAREAKISPAHTTRILKTLREQNIVKHRKSGRQDFYRLNLDSPLARKIFDLYCVDRRLNLPSGFRAALEEFVRKLKRELGNNLISIVLFGSLAKGKIRPESDIDILIVAEDVLKTRDTARDLFSEISIFYDKLIEEHVYSREDFDSAYKQGNDLIINTLKNGLILHDNEFYIEYLKKELPTPSKEHIQNTLDFARKNLKNAEELISKDNASAIIPLRMVVRDSGRALLLTKDEIPGSRHELGKQIKRFNKGYGRLIEDINRKYEQHMKEGKEIKKELLLRYLEKAEKFLREVIEVFESA